MGEIKITDHSAEYLKDVDAALETAMEAVGIHVEGEAKEELSNSPRRIDTGLLRNSITYAVDGEAPATATYHADNANKNGSTNIGSYSGTAPKESGHNRSVMIGTNVEYALYVHEGTSRMAPNRFLKNAVERNKDQITTCIKNAMS